MTFSLLRFRTAPWFLSTAILAFGGLSLANAATTVTSSALDHIIILPNDRPTLVNINTDMQFVASGYTADEQPIPGLTFNWSASGGVGRITEDGIFTGERGGIGGVSAKSGTVTATVGVVVRGVAKKSVKAAPTNTTIPPATTTVTPRTGASPETTTNVAPSGDAGTVNANLAPATPDTMVTTECTTIRGWVWSLIVLVYCILLIVYFFALGDSRTSWWWIWPVLLTAELLILYFSVRCGQFQSWVPWTTAVLGVLIALFYYRLLRPKDVLTSPPNLHQP